MTKPNRKKQKTQYLDGEMLFKYYWQTMGTARSYDGVVRYCIANNILNPVLGTPPTKMSIMKAMWRWAIRKENFEDGYEIVNTSMRDEGEFMNKDEWKEFLFERVGSAYQYNEKHEKRFLKKHGYQVQSSNS